MESIFFSLRLVTTKVVLSSFGRHAMFWFSARGAEGAPEERRVV